MQYSIYSNQQNIYHIYDIYDTAARVSNNSLILQLLDIAMRPASCIIDTFYRFWRYSYSTDEPRASQVVIP